MYTLYGIALLLKSGLKFKIEEKFLTIECNCDSAFRITHKELQSAYHVMNTTDKILICYNNKKVEMSYQEAGNNIFSFRKSYKEWLQTISEKCVKEVRTKK